MYPDLRWCSDQDLDYQETPRIFRIIFIAVQLYLLKSETRFIQYFFHKFEADPVHDNTQDFVEESMSTRRRLVKKINLIKKLSTMFKMTSTLTFEETRVPEEQDLGTHFGCHSEIFRIFLEPELTAKYPTSFARGRGRWGSGRRGRGGRRGVRRGKSCIK